MTTIVSKFDELQARYGGESLFGMCGTSRVWCMFWGVQRYVLVGFS